MIFKLNIFPAILRIKQHFQEKNRSGISTISKKIMNNKIPK